MRIPYLQFLFYPRSNTWDGVTLHSLVANITVIMGDYYIIKLFGINACILNGSIRSEIRNVGIGKIFFDIPALPDPRNGFKFFNNDSIGLIKSGTIFIEEPVFSKI